MKMWNKLPEEKTLFGNDGGGLPVRMLLINQKHKTNMEITTFKNADYQIIPIVSFAPGNEHVPATIGLGWLRGRLVFSFGCSHRKQRGRTAPNRALKVLLSVPAAMREAYRCGLDDQKSVCKHFIDEERERFLAAVQEEFHFFIERLLEKDEKCFRKDILSEDAKVWEEDFKYAIRKHINHHKIFGKEQG